MKFLLVLGLINLTGCYMMKQGWHQGRVLLSAESINEVPNDTRLSERQKLKFEELKEVLNFAKSYGLDVGESYSKYIFQSSPVSYLVQASYPDRLEPVTWWFPVVGTVPYLGFFDEEDRDDEAKRLADQGFDIHLGYAAAFSGLGYFDDPIFTSMLNRSKPSMAHLFFHELTHRTLWLPGSVRFNENLAEFIGEYLTELYLKETPAEYESYLERRADNKLYRTWLRELKRELKNLYSRYDLRAEGGQKAEKEAVMLKEKELLFHKFTAERLPSFKTNRYDWVAKRKWNNASVLASSLYSPETEKFREAFECVKPQTLQAYFRELKLAIDDGHKGLEILKVLCERNRQH